MEILVTSPGFTKSIPEEPGVYRFYAIAENSNAEGELLYVGKALNLLKRVKSYFQKTSALSPRISLMVSKIAKIEITVTENEVSALILENNLIKSLKPKYNIIFRDDKSYPLIRMSRHAYPKLDSFRGKPNTRDQYFGPYPNSSAVKQNLDMIGRIFKLRTCTDSVFANRVRPCILYEIKRCTAPCVNLVTPQEYKGQVELAMDFLNGKFSRVIENLTSQMYAYSELMEFEKAAVIRDKLGLIKHISASQIINNYNQPVSADLLFCAPSANKVFIYLIILRNGLYIGDKHFILDDIENSAEAVFEVFLESYYLEKQNTYDIYTTFKLSQEFIDLFFQAFHIKISNSRNKQVAKLYQMGQVNLNKIIEQYQSPENLSIAAAKLAELIGIPSISRMECIDVSHNHGENTVASLVVYENGIIDHSKYRKYNLTEDIQGKPINGNDLLATETVLRRRLSNTELQLPDVILADGGRLQLETLKMILIAMGLYDKIRLVALFKGERRDPVFDRLLLEDGRVINYTKGLFELLQGMRDEAHRFAITGHRKKQIKKMTASQLADIPNLGVKKKRALLAHFGSVKNVADAGISELQQVNGIGAVLANQIYTFFH